MQRLSLKSYEAQRGSALLLAVILVAVLSIGAATLYRHLNRSFTDHVRFERDLLTLHLAEAGMDAALATLREGRAPVPTDFELTLGEGTIHVSITPTSEAEVYHITSRAELRDGPIVRAEDTYNVALRLTSDGRSQRLSWQREKRQQ